MLCAQEFKHIGHKPVAFVRPMQLAEIQMQVAKQPNDQVSCGQQPMATSIAGTEDITVTATITAQMKKPIVPTKSGNVRKFTTNSNNNNNTRRIYAAAATSSSGDTRRRPCAELRLLSACAQCGTCIALRAPAASSERTLRRSKHAKCHECRKANLERRNIRTVAGSTTTTKAAAAATKVIALTKEATKENQRPLATKLGNQIQRFKPPILDGKVVSMLRRLGTIIEREQQQQQQQRLIIESKSKSAASQQRRPLQAINQIWSTAVDENAVTLIKFTSSIFDVMPDDLRRRYQQEHVGLGLERL